MEHRGSAASSLSSSLAKARGKGSKGGAGGDGYAGKFVWRIEAFTRLKDLLKKRKITGLCIKSRRFTVGGRDCRLIVYPRGALLMFCLFCCMQRRRCAQLPSDQLWSDVLLSVMLLNWCSCRSEMTPPV